jgi:hypothetical protein
LRKLAAVGASAALGQMILLSGPVWALEFRRDVEVSAGPSLRILMTALLILALLGLGASTVVALFRMVSADRNREIGLGEWIYRRIVAVLALAQVALPICLVASITLPNSITGLDLRLMSAVNGVSRLPTAGKNLVVVADVDQVLHFRIFDGDAKMVVDTDEKRLTDRVLPIEALRNQLASLWSRHELTRSEKGRVITAVTKIVGHTPSTLTELDGGLDAANLLLYLVRTTRLVNGVTPLMPFLLLGIAGGVVMLGDWRRGGLRVWMNATGEAPGLSSGPLSAVWSGFQKTREALDIPWKAWPDAGFFATLPFWVILALVGIYFDNSMPKDIEPYPMFIYSFILAFVVTLLLLVVRLVDLMGLVWRFNRLLRRLAEIPMVRAFDRIPALFAHVNPWLHGASGTLAEDATNPRIDRQFEALVVGYQSNLQAIRTERRLRFADLRPLDNLIRDYCGNGGLLTKQWWTAVDALTPLLAPFWASRSAIPSPAGGDKKSSGDELADWPEVDNPKLRTWLGSAEDLIAMVMARQIAWLRASVQLTLSFIVVGLVMTFAVLTSYPFEPQEPMYAVLGVLTLITVGSIVVVAVHASRDEVLSRLNKSPTDRFSFDRHFITTMITFVVPLLGLLGAFSYSLSDLFRSLFEPFFRGN